MMERIIEDLKRIYRHRPDRLRHVYGVRDMAVRLGKIHGADLDTLRLAAYLHDITKYEDEAFQRTWALKRVSEETLARFDKPLWHAFSAAAVAKEVYGIDDETVLTAIEHHTVGRPKMNLIEKILFISDYIEPTRLYPACVKAREIAFNDLDHAVNVALEEGIRHYEKVGGKIPDLAYDAHHHYAKRGGHHEQN